MEERRGRGGDARSFLKEAGPERLIGTPEQVLEQLSVFAAAGVERGMLQHLVHDELESLALIGREVIPEATNTASDPASTLLTTAGPETWVIGTSPETRARIAVVPPVKKISSTSNPFLLKIPESLAIQAGI